jgi:hypothetical protein
MLIKYITIIIINILLFLNSSVKADTPNYIVGNNQEKINQRIDSFFIKYPDVKRVIWKPKIKGKSKYAFLIQKNAYLSSKKYADASDLYYLSKKIDEGLKFEPNNSKQIDISLLKSNFNVTYKKRHLLGVETGVFFENKDNSFGMIINKEFILFNNVLANFELKQAKDKYTVFDAKFVKLAIDENSEFYGNINHAYKSDHTNVGIGYRWFDIANQIDFTLGIHEQDSQLGSDLNVAFGDENMKFQIGLEKKDSSNMNIFFNLKLEDILNKKKYGTKVIIASKDNVFGLRSLSLKSFRKKNLDLVWKKYMEYN